MSKEGQERGVQPNLHFSNTMKISSINTDLGP